MSLYWGAKERLGKKALAMLIFSLYFCNQDKNQKGNPFALLFYKRANNYLDNNKNQPHNCLFFYVGGIPKWLTGADCKSAGLGLRRFESYSHHHFYWLRVILAGVAQW